jgi:hypothetical protein
MPSIINATTSTGLVSSADNSGSLQLATNNGTTAVTIDTSQRVGIGTTTPDSSTKLEVSGGQFRLTASSASSMFLVNPSTTYADGVDIQATYNGAGSFGPLKFTTSGTERMRVGADGVLCVGRTSASVSTNMVVDGNGGLTIERTSNGYRRMTMTSSIMYFFNGSNEATLSSSGAWTNASDARLKTNIEPIKYGLNTVLETQPRSFNRVDVEGDYIGFVAQELKEKIPEVVFGEEERQYSVDYGSLVAVAFKAIQELSASVDTLNAKVEAQAVRIAELEGAK